LGRALVRLADLQVTIGLQLGGQAYSVVVFFQNQAALDDFKRGRLKLDAQASAIALTARAAADIAYRNGVAIVTMAKGGLMYEASHLRAGESGLLAPEWNNGNLPK
jgi:lipid-binding SYLF domain-containing protein